MDRALAHGINLNLLTTTDRAVELKAVKNEGRERLEIQPYSAARHALWSQLFPISNISTSAAIACRSCWSAIPKSSRPRCHRSVSAN